MIDVKEMIRKTINEKWDEETETPKSKKGMWDGYSLEDLHKARETATGTRLKEIDFAIRSKTGWGKVNESVDFETDKLKTEHLIRRGEYHENQFLHHSRANEIKPSIFHKVMGLYHAGKAYEHYKQGYEVIKKHI